ncbi:YbjN domain-containing protein [Oscillatoria sp. FACHB-1406]|uniref:YbjN domain-containing protein n=1 Tax=Oscillatoria sp. FACHB-1406 TaxID=2692846 RepID=UPI0016880F9C|nr:YbjN domain-containing protein [Oscillatoria sp. FACHB-1406]MBD2580433.1 YbjN domain-containing protein [Oscillatoria sp. FACHB-1406]
MTSPETETETLPTTSDAEAEAISDELIEQQTSSREIIETAISSLDAEGTAMVAQSEEGFLWKFQYGSVEVFIQMTGESDEDIFTVWAAVLPLPAKNEDALFRKLMEMNWSGTFETSFGIYNQQIVISCQRAIADLSPQEVSRAITLVCSIADEYNESLKAEFGQ